MSAFLDRIGVGATHASRVFRGVHRDMLPLSEIQSLGRHAGVIEANSHMATIELSEIHTSPDGTRRLVIGLEDGNRVESVLIPMRDDRQTLCLSTQVGCAMACRFCATGTLGLTRSLTAGEIVAQVHAARKLIAGENRELRNLVYMGMGEPLHAYDATIGSVRVLSDDHGVNFGSQHITVSTVGLIERIRQFGEEFGGRVMLALSLHAGTDATRQRIIPTAARVSMADLRAACLAHPLPGRRVLMLEYAVLPGINDTDDELAAVAEWRQGMRAVVNLIPFNPFPGAPYRSPTRAEVISAYNRLQAMRVPATIRWPRGRGADGACGQLALRERVEAPAG
ncbi:MAG: 23S rRNA (adenine2503-C2)-methyltransferase [Myxococcota bacterium]|jgi:23S rRNA (adenine2503-C2)-methyltransferase